ncbi:MAG: hypothetical protein ABI693_03595 [Bryobacteraceae bacterium]
MSQEFDAYEYFEYLGRHWRSVAITCGTALTIALVVSLALPKQYQATASLLIDPPAGSDLRTATAVSPVYLESLKTYERMADGDSLFQRAAERFHLLNAAEHTSLESLKRRTLKVTKLRDTRILQIAVTLESARTAQALAQYLAEETVRLSQLVLRDSEGDIIEDARKQMEGARARMDGVQKAWSDFSATASIDALRAEIETLTEVNTQAQRDAMIAGTDVAEWTERAKAGNPELDRARRELQASQARAAALQREAKATTTEIGTKSETLARQRARQEQLESQLREMTAAYMAAVARLQEVRSAAGYRGERLKVFDPGVVPERPVSPNLPLNLLAALLAGLLVACVHLSIRFGYERRHRPAWRDATVRTER